MKQLTILRHGKASRPDSALADFDRPLTAGGSADARRMGLWLRQQGCAPDLVLASPARRARATAEAAVEALGLPAERLQFRDEIYEAGCATLLGMLHACPESVRHILLVGHNPGLTELWNRLSPATSENIPPCGAFSLQLAAESWPELAAAKGAPVFMATEAPAGSGVLDAVEGLRRQVESLAAAVRERFSGAAPAAGAKKVEKQILKLADVLDRIAAHPELRPKKTGRRLAKADRRLAGIENRDGTDIARGLKATRQKLEKSVK